MANLVIQQYKNRTQREEGKVLRATVGQGDVLASLAAWLSRPCQLFSPPGHRWNLKLAKRIVEVDGLFIEHLPHSMARTIKVQRAALLSILRFGVRASCSVTSRPLFSRLFANFDTLSAEWPKGLLHPGRARSLFWKVLGSHAVDVRDLLAMDGRNMNYLPAEMRDCDMYGRAVANSQISLCGARYVSLRLRNCPSFMAYAISKRPPAYLLCSAALRSRDLYLLRLSLAGGFESALYCTCAPLRTSSAAGSAAVWAADGLRGLPQDLRGNADYLCKLAPECGLLLLNGLSDPLLRDDGFRTRLARARPDLATALQISVREEPSEALVNEVPLSKRPREVESERSRKRARIQELLHCPICMDTKD